MLIVITFFKSDEHRYDNDVVVMHPEWRIKGNLPSLEGRNENTKCYGKPGWVAQ
jgi:hypothetical protein